MRIKKEIIISLFAVIIGLLAGAILILVTGNNPIEGYLYLFQGGLKNVERIGNTLATATPLILTGLSVAFAFKTGLFNIGAPGQMLFGGFCATAVGLSLNLPRPLLLLVMLMAGFIGGSLWALVPGILKAKFNVHEVVSSIMMNWISYWTIYYIIPSYFKGENLETESRQLPAVASLQVKWLSELFGGSYLNLGIFIGILSAIIIAFILNKTVLGYELKAVGFNRHAAEYGGINVNRNIIFSMMIAGGLAGLAGFVQYTGNASNIQIGILPSQGYDGIAVSLLASNSPLGVILSAIFFGLLYSGRGFMSAMTEIPPEIADTIIAIIIYFAATSTLVERFLNKIKHRAAGSTGYIKKDNKEEHRKKVKK